MAELLKVSPRNEIRYIKTSQHVTSSLVKTLDEKAKAIFGRGIAGVTEVNDEMLLWVRKSIFDEKQFTSRLGQFNKQVANY